MSALVRTRPATPDDVDAVVELVESAYRGDTSRAGWTTEADLLDGRRTDAAMVRGLLDDPRSVLLVLEGEDGGLLGCCHLQRPADDATDDADAADEGAEGAGGRDVHFGLFAVRPTQQGHGLGSRLLAAAEEQARAWGADRLVLTVLNHRPELRAWYARRGFVATGVVHPFPAYADSRFGLPRRDDLVLLEMAKPLG